VTVNPWRASSRTSSPRQNHFLEIGTLNVKNIVLFNSGSDLESSRFEELMSKVRVLLADDDTLFRQGVERILSAQNDIEVVSEVSNGGDAVNECTKVLVDVVLIDISMPGLSSFEATREIKKARPETKVLFLSMLEDEDYLHCAMESGASGYVLTDSTAPQLIAAIREVARGGSHLSARMLAYFAEKLQGGFNKKVSRFGTLTTRERQILKALAEGKSVKEIASDANLSRKTVEAHKFNLMRKLDIHNKAQLVHYAVRMNIVQVRF
jgi:two-component system response regulator NreC